MALSGTIAATSTNSNITGRIDWTATQDIAGNYSNVTATLKMWKNSSTATYGTGYFNLSINGTTYQRSATFSFSNNTVVTCITNTVKVDHNTDGTKSINISIVNNSPNSNYSGLPGTSYTETYATATITLDTIPRNSTITAFSAFTAITSGSTNLSTTTTNYSASYNLNFTLKYGTTAIKSWTGLSCTVGSQARTLTLTAAEQITLINLITTSATGTVTLECITKNGTTVIGSTSTSPGTTVTIHSSVVPSITVFTNTDSVSAVASTVGKYVQNLSNITITLTGTGIYGSTISTKKVRYNNVDYTTSPFNTGIISWSGDNIITATVTDSRGRSATSSITLNALAYTTPKVQTFTVNRCNNLGNADPLGTYVSIVRYGTASSLINSTERNNISVKIYYKEKSVATYDSNDILANMSVVATNNLNAVDNTPLVSSSGLFLETTAYDFKMELKDAFNTTILEQNLGTGKIIMGWSDKGVGFGKFPTEEYSIDVGGTANIEKAILSYPILVSPDGTKFRLQVSDLGVLSVVEEV